MGFILGSDMARFGILFKDLEKLTQGSKSFTQALTKAFNILNNWRNNPIERFSDIYQQKG